MYILKLVTVILTFYFITLYTYAHENTATLSELFQPNESSSAEAEYVNPIIASLRYIASSVTTASQIISIEPLLERYQSHLDQELMNFQPELPDPLPAHVAIIMDGNRRWAKLENHQDTSYGHCFGAARLRQIVQISEKIGISQLTVYAFSENNWQRTKHEVGILMSMIKSVLDYWQPELLKLNVKVHNLGSESGLDKDVLQSIQNIIEKTKDNTGLILNIVFNYGELQEAADACQSACMRAEGTPITASIFSAHLYTGKVKGWTNPDLLIRTSGEMRISGFLPLQISYSEMFFSNSYWPDFSPEEFITGIRVYSQRKRRFGQ